MSSCSNIGSNNCRLYDLRTQNARLKTSHFGNEIFKLQPSTPASVLKIQFYSYLVENSQKATLNVLFKSKFSKNFKYIL